MDRALEVSIVTPSYNQGNFIEETLLSVKRQRYPNVEHIVVDGASTDETLTILQNYESEYDLKWVSQPDDGQSDAVNRGFEMAEGDIVGWLNADDVYVDVDAVGNVVDYFERNSKAAVVYGDDVYIDEDGTVFKLRKIYDWNYERMIRYGWWGWTPASEATFYRANVVENNLLDTDLEYVMDLEYFIRLGQQYDFDHIDHFIAGKRMHEDAKSRDREKVTEEARRVLERNGFSFTLSNRLLLWFTAISIQFRNLRGITALREIDLDTFAFDGTVHQPRKLLLTQAPKLSKLLR